MNAPTLPGFEQFAPEPPHTCHAERCPRTVPERMLMCRHHWKMVPPHMQRQVWAVYVEGQEITKTPTRIYLETTRRVIEYVAELERRGDSFGRSIGENPSG